MSSKKNSIMPNRFFRGWGEKVCRGGFALLSSWSRACVQYL